MSLSLDLMNEPCKNICRERSDKPSRPLSSPTRGPYPGFEAPEDSGNCVGPGALYLPATHAKAAQDDLGPTDKKALSRLVTTIKNEEIVR